MLFVARTYFNDAVSAVFPIPLLDDRQKEKKKEKVGSRENKVY